MVIIGSVTAEIFDGVFSSCSSYDRGKTKSTSTEVWQKSDYESLGIGEKECPTLGLGCAPKF